MVGKTNAAGISRWHWRRKASTIPGTFASWVTIRPISSSAERTRLLSLLTGQISPVVFPEFDMRSGSPVAKTMHTDGQEQHDGTK